MRTRMADKLNVEACIRGLEQATGADGPQGRRKALDRLVVLLFTTDTAAPALVSLGGVRLLLDATRDRDEKVRLHAVHALARLASVGYTKAVRDAGGVPALKALLDDPYLPIREMAAKALEKLQEI